MARVGRDVEMSKRRRHEYLYSRGCALGEPHYCWVGFE
jgi:hypothetical protein